jgi:hypothetical protein
MAQTTEGRLERGRLQGAPTVLCDRLDGLVQFATALVAAVKLVFRHQFGLLRVFFDVDRRQ